jgi:hypothetical protein
MPNRTQVKLNGIITALAVALATIAATSPFFA